MAKELSATELQELRGWLDKFRLNRLIVLNKIHRDLSDGVIVALILKEISPKLIDLHNYTSSSSVQLKRNNWETLNNKVFKKLGIQQTTQVLESISRSVPGYIQQLLYDIMKFENSLRGKIQKSLSREETASFAINDEVLVVNFNKQIGDAIMQVPQKMILYSVYEQALQESREKDTKLGVLGQKLVHLENVIKLKTERIEELCDQLANLSFRKTKNNSYTNSLDSDIIDCSIINNNNGIQI